jgi:serine/threonine protein kinase
VVKQNDTAHLADQLFQKSGNVLLDADRTCLISDFGLSKISNVGTQTMSAIGTPHYMAPEILRGERYSASADVWAFGVLVFELVERQIPFQGISGIAVMQRVAHEGARVDIARDHVLFPVLDACLAAQPQQRPTFEALQQRLAAIQI